MKFEATFSERGRVMTRTYDKPDATKEDVIEWFGLREHDIDWFTIKEINELLEAHGGDKLEGWNWCSSENSELYAWFVNFNDGYVNFSGKYNTYYVRAVSALLSMTRFVKTIRGSRCQKMKCANLPGPSQRLLACAMWLMKQLEK